MKGPRMPILLGLEPRDLTLGGDQEKQVLEKLLSQKKQQELSSRGRRARPAPGHLLLPILDLRLPAKLQSCFCFSAEEIL